ncbi:type IV secretory system conjugative DNA transfer family protein [Bifidobacterium vansinderenii]|uniref:AAA-like domain-containing protein n=1 Tax=Bifidobacterium vansinderenii TaxID=1984871 RepID=A0A229VXT9_9BIFI|nr:type IV secretion system DNA-binding domain-containing protein [Bifidobacterium vansinderenii]OXN00210.1 AAA-like domain-containing protein [Bifidobacterium vansinderenii]
MANEISKRNGSISDNASATTTRRTRRARTKTVRSRTTQTRQTARPASGVRSAKPIVTHSWIALPVLSLQQGKDRQSRIVTMTRRLIDIVNMSSATMMIRIGSSSGRLNVTVAASPDAVESIECPTPRDERIFAAWADDMRYVFDGILNFADETRVLLDPVYERDAYEATIPLSWAVNDRPATQPMVPIGFDMPDEPSLDDRFFTIMNDDLQYSPHGFSNGMPSPIDALHTKDVASLFDTMLQHDDTTITYMMHRADPTAQTTITQLYDANRDFSKLSDLPNTPPIRFHATISAPVMVSRAVLSEFKTLTSADFRHLTMQDHLDSCDPDSVTLRGSLMPAAGASAFLRLPVAGTKPFPGMRSERMPIEPHVLDPMPEPATTMPIRIGSAVTAEGEHVDVTLEATDLTRHLHVLGAPGSGKTTFLVDLACELADQGVGFIFLSTHRDLMDRIMLNVRQTAGFRTFGVDHADKVNVTPLNPLSGDNDDNTFAMKVNEITNALKEYIDPTNQGMFGERASSAFSLIAQTYRMLGTASIPMVTSTLVRQDLCEKLAVKMRDVDMQTALHIRHELSGLSSSDGKDMFSWLGSRFNVLHSSPMLMNILGSGINAIDLVDCMDRGVGLAVNLAGSELGQSAAQFLLACWLIQVKSAMLQRQHTDKPFVVVVDEAHAAAFGPLTSMLDEARKFGVCVVVAHQRIGQLNSHLADALEADAGSFIALRAGLRDASRASAQLGGWPEDELMHMPTFRGAAMITRDGVPTEPFTLEVDPPRDLGDQSEHLRHLLGVSPYTQLARNLNVPTPHTVSRFIDALHADR